MCVLLRWRAAFYIAGEHGCMGNFINLLDDFLTRKMKAIQKEVEAGLWSRHLFVVVGGCGRLFLKCISTRAG